MDGKTRLGLGVLGGALALGLLGDWLLRAAEETQMVICMHVGSSSQLPAICHDAPPLANIAFGAMRTAGTL